MTKSGPLPGGAPPGGFTATGHPTADVTGSASLFFQLANVLGAGTLRVLDEIELDAVALGEGLEA
jgi:hypothetical protein